MNIALVQSHIFWEDRKRNLAKAEKAVSDNPGTELFLFPEMSFTGFSMNTSKTADKNQETVNEVKRIAAAYGVSMGFGWVRQNGEKCENVYTVAGPDGQIISEYIKIHPFTFSGENKHFSAGFDFSVYKIGGIPFSTFICYDLRFPELFRHICKKVHAVIIPANWPAKRSEHWKTLLRARAIENQVYIFAVNCAGKMDAVYYSGDSCIIDPNGDILMSLSDREGILKFDFIDNTDQYRNAFPVLDDIRFDLYSGC